MGIKQKAEELRRLAHDKSKKSRSKLLTVINDLFSDHARTLSDSDREMMLEIMRLLIGQVECSVRRALAENLVNLPEAPRDLTLALANDQIEVAYPVLVKSEILKDPDLIEIIQHHAMAHQVCVAMRPTISERVTDALVMTGNQKVIDTAVSNQGANFSDQTMQKLVVQSEGDAAFQELLAGRTDLPPQILAKLYWMVSAALRQHIMQSYDVDESALDSTMEATVRRALNGVVTEAPQTEPECNGHVTNLSRDEESAALKTLNDGGVFEFIDVLVKRSGLRVRLVQRILFEEGGEGLAILCNAIGISKFGFAEIFLRFRQGRLGDKMVPEDELSKAIAFYDEATEDSARTMVSRWRRDPEYLNALRLVEAD